MNYWETYSPAVNWISVRFLLILSELAGLESRTIDFVLAFPQAELDVPVYMELPIGMEVGDSQQNRKIHVLRLKKSLYGLKQASANWHDMLKRGLESRGFSESVADPCVFIKQSTKQELGTESKPVKEIQSSPSASKSIKSTAENSWITEFQQTSSDIIVLVYVDDCIILSRNKESITSFIDTLTHGPEKFAFTDEGPINKYLGVNIEQLCDKAGFKMLQPHLIQRIIEAANIDLKFTNSCPTPAVNPLLSRDEQGPDRTHDWKYRTLTGILGYLQLTS